MKITEVRSTVDEIHHINQLKDEPRIGWERSGVRGGETVASHVFGVWIIHGRAAYKLRNAGVVYNAAHVDLLIRDHDVGEADTGDWPIKKIDGQVDEITKRGRDAIERAALIARYGEGHEIVAHFDEFTFGDTIEARIARACDKYDLLDRALKLEERTRLPLGDYYIGLDEVFHDASPVFVEMFRELKRKRSIMIKRWIVQWSLELRRTRLEPSLG